MQQEEVVSPAKILIGDKQNQKTVRTAVNGEKLHKNYLYYLSQAWAKHYGVIVSPDLIWYTVLAELAVEIKANHKKYKDLFTTSDEKVNILVPISDPELIDLNLIADRLNELVPTNTGLFLPKFSTSTPESQLAFKAAFADAVSPYYNYGMYMCDITSVKVLGTKEDWDLMLGNIASLKELVSIDDEPLKIRGRVDRGNYFDRVSNIISKIKGTYNEPNDEFLKGIFELERCGSGGQVEVKGWITDLYIKLPPVLYLENFNSHISVVSYKNLSTNENFELNYGLFSSNVNEDNDLVPEFGFIINQIVNDN